MTQNSSQNFDSFDSKKTKLQVVKKNKSSSWWFLVCQSALNQICIPCDKNIINFENISEKLLVITFQRDCLEFTIM